MDANRPVRHRAIACAVFAGLLTLPAELLAAGQLMFSTVADATADKPQSKLFRHDGSWWCVLQGSAGVAFYRFTEGAWQRGTFTNAVLQSSGHADVKWNGTNLFVLVYASTAKLYKYTYDAPSRAWVLVSGFPVNLPKPSSTETMVLDQDSSGRLWMTTDSGDKVYAYYSTSADHRTWSGTPVTLATGVDDDDISSIVAFGGDKIGVFWSDQRRDQFSFRVHRDADAPTTWGSTEVVYSGSGSTDDHVHLAFDSSGRVYAVSKDALDRVQVHRRSTSGTWTTKTNIAGGRATRPIIMVAETDAKVYVVYTRWGVSPYRVEYRVANIDNLTFGGETIFISSSSAMNNPTGTKQILPAGTLIAAAGTSSQAWWNGFGALDGGTPPPPSPPGAPTNLTAALQFSAPPTTGSLLYLHMNETGSQTATDASGNGNHAQLGLSTGADGGDPSWVTGRSGSALEFGGDDFLEIADSPSLDPGGSFTIETWIRRNGGTDGIVVNKGGATRTYRVALNSGRVQFRWHTTTGTEYQLMTSSALSDHTWHHIACVYDQAAGQNRIYVNGLLTATGTASGIPSPNDKRLNIGAREPDYSDFLLGALDELQISSGAKYTGNFTPPAAAVDAPITSAALGPGKVELAYPSGSSIDLQWNPPSGGAAVAGYRMYRAINGGAYALLNATLITGTRYTDLDMVSGQHCYRVAAVGTTSLEGPVSNVACVSEPTSALAGDESTSDWEPMDALLDRSLEFTVLPVPNPMRGTGALHLTLGRGGVVSGAFYDLAGRRVATLVEPTSFEPGRHSILFDLRSARGDRLPAGIYLYRVESAEGIRTGRVVVLD